MKKLLASDGAAQNYICFDCHRNMGIYCARNESRNRGHGS